MTSFVPGVVSYSYMRFGPMADGTQVAALFAWHATA